jgi:hypothetical protein
MAWRTAFQEGRFLLALDPYGGRMMAEILHQGGYLCLSTI